MHEPVAKVTMYWMGLTYYVVKITKGVLMQEASLKEEFMEHHKINKKYPHQVRTRYYTKMA